MLEKGAEVARVEFDDPGDINPDYMDVPTIGSARLEIQLIEVSAEACGRRIGTRW
ncbi:hypothetical protein [Mycobacterium sp.]|uniref:hypothetical protein n=1 Tax=Mycobacterium sp. TaxID=1785 RepID=UPI0031D23D7A